MVQIFHLTRSSAGLKPLSRGKARFVIRALHGSDAFLSRFFTVCTAQYGRHSGLIVSALVPRASGPGSSPGRDTVLCSWARHSTLTVPLSTQEYKWVPANCWGNLTNCGKVTCNGLASHQGGVEILLAASCYRNQDKLQKLWASLGSKASQHTLSHHLLEGNWRLTKSA